MMARNKVAVASVIGICVLLSISAACASSYSLANGKYSWKSSVMDPKYGKPDQHEGIVRVTRDGNKVTIELPKAQIVGTLQGDEFSGHVAERQGDYTDLQGVLTGNNRMEGTLTGKSRGKDVTGNWTLEFISDK